MVLNEPARSSNSSPLVMVTVVSNCWRAINSVPSVSAFSGSMLLRTCVWLTQATTMMASRRMMGNVRLKSASGASTWVLDSPSTMRQLGAA